MATSTTVGENNDIIVIDDSDEDENVDNNDIIVIEDSEDESDDESAPCGHCGRIVCEWTCGTKVQLNSYHWILSKKWTIQMSNNTRMRVI